MTDTATGTMPRLEQGSVLGWNLAFSAGATAAGYAMVSPRFAMGLALGAVLEVLNFRSLFSSCERIFLSGMPGAGPAVAAFGARFGLLALVIMAALWAGTDPAGLLVGLSLIMPAAVLAAWRARPPIDPDARALPEDDPAWDLWNPWLAREQDPDQEEEA